MAIVLFRQGSNAAVSSSSEPTSSTANLVARRTRSLAVRALASSENPWDAFDGRVATLRVWRGEPEARQTSHTSAWRPQPQLPPWTIPNHICHDEVYGARDAPRSGDEVFKHPFIRELLAAARDRVARGAPWVLCIRTYGRAGSGGRSPSTGVATLDALERAGLGKLPYREWIHVFVSHEDPDFRSGRYSDSLGHWADRIVVGVRGADLQVRFIEKCFCRGQHVIVSDDNIAWLRVSKGNYEFRPLQTEPCELADLFDRASQTMARKGAHLWGISQTSNPKFLAAKSNSIGTRLGLVYGAFFGFICLHESQLYTAFGQVKDDVERTLRYWHRDRVVIRFNRYICRKHQKPGRHGVSKGGISANLSQSAHQQEADRALSLLANGFAKPYVSLPLPSDRKLDLFGKPMTRANGKPIWKAYVSDTGLIFRGHRTMYDMVGKAWPPPDHALMSGYFCKLCRQLLETLHGQPCANSPATVQGCECVRPVELKAREDMVREMRCELQEVPGQEIGALVEHSWRQLQGGRRAELEANASARLASLQWAPLRGESSDQNNQQKKGRPCHSPSRSADARPALTSLPRPTLSFGAPKASTTLKTAQLNKKRKMESSSCSMVTPTKPAVVKAETVGAKDQHMKRQRCASDTSDTPRVPYRGDAVKTSKAATPKAASKAPLVSTKKQQHSKNERFGLNATCTPSDPNSEVAPKKTDKVTPSTQAVASNVAATKDAKIESIFIEKPLVSDVTVGQHVSDALLAGVPQAEVTRWAIDCSRNFYVIDDPSFIRAWCDFRRRWHALEAKRRRRDVSRQGVSAKPQPKLATGPAAAVGKPCLDDDPKRSSASAPKTSISDRRNSSLSSKDVAWYVRMAEEDVRKGLCASLEQALAVRLTVGLGEKALQVLSGLRPLLKNREQMTLGATAEDEQEPSLKKLFLLVHPDKTTHPCAKEAFQRLMPILREQEIRQAESFPKHGVSSSEDPRDKKKGKHGKA